MVPEISALFKNILQIFCEVWHVFRKTPRNVLFSAWIMSVPNYPTKRDVHPCVHDSMLLR